MTNKFILHKAIFDNQERLEEAEKLVRLNGLKPIIVSGHPIEVKNEQFAIDLKGSIGLITLSWAKALKLFNFKDFHVTGYAEFLGQDFVNNKYVITSLYLLRDHKSSGELTEWIKEFGNGLGLFIKPNSGFKQFTGFTLTKDNLRELDSLTIGLHDLIVIASAKTVIAEWRFWVINYKVNTYSGYSWTNQETECTEEVHEFVLEVIKKIPYRQYTLDVGLVDYQGKIEPKVIELNSIYTSGTYKCDLDKLIKEFGL